MQLYIHIPFCKKKCRYCSFSSFEGCETEAENYINLVLQEAEKRKDEFCENITTVYIGGGTPSLLSPDLLLLLTDGLKKRYSWGGLTEFTIEANPGTVSERWLDAAVQSGVNRLSIGMQSFQSEILQTLGRIHCFADVKNTVQLAHRMGIENISLDLMFGIPGQTLSGWKETLAAAVSLEPYHISAYGLIPEEGTPIDRDLKAGRLTLPDPDIERDMYDEVIRYLAGWRYQQYEVSNFALPGYKCQHNIGYWKQVPYVGLGVSAASMQVLSRGKDGLICRRKRNPLTLKAYETMVFQCLLPEEDEIIPERDTRFESLMLALRMNEGISEKAFESMHGVTLEETYGDRLRRMEQQNLLNHVNGFWRLTRRGFDIQNSVLVELMDD